jgi:3-oxoacyl-[acyl-carrier protein] reductase
VQTAIQRPDAPRLGGKVVVVTGASGGIGSATALRLAEMGARVGLNYLSGEASARQVLETIRERGGQATLLHADVGDEGQVHRMAEQVAQELGPVTLLVNNSGQGADHNQVQDMTLAEWDRVIRTNLSGAFLCTREFVPTMVKAGFGRIVNVSSICGLSGDCDPAYCATKAGILGLTRSCAARLAPTVQVNAVLPGFVGMKHHADRQERIRGVAPDGRVSDPREIAELIGVLLALESRFLTGACIPIDGGASIASLGMHMDWIRGPE